MEYLIVCGHCEWTLKSPYTSNTRCSVCGKRRWSIKHITDIKAYIWDANYYWYDSIKSTLWNNVFDYIESMWPDGIVFTKNKHNWWKSSRHWRIRKRAKRSIYANDNIQMSTLWAIAKWFPISYEQAFLMIKYYCWWEDKPIVSNKSQWWIGIKYIDNHLFIWIRNMCNKYLAVARGDIDYDENEEVIMFTIENKIDRNLLQKVAWAKKLRETEVWNLIDIFNEYKKAY